MAQSMNPHDIMRVNMVKGRLGSKKHMQMGGHKGHASGMHHVPHAGGMGNPAGAGGPAPGMGPMGSGTTQPSMAGF